MHFGGLVVKFFRADREASVKPVAFVRLKADEPREAKHEGFPGLGHGKSARTDPDAQP